MATAAPNQGLPMFYEQLQAVNLGQHGQMKMRKLDGVPRIAKAHAIPATVDEFALLQRHYPIIFSVGDNPIPLALMGLTEGINVFLDDKGLLRDPKVYAPAYIRRFPFLLARLNPESDELSLCFDPTSDVIGEFDEGQPLFEDGQPSKAVQDVLGFCEQFETAGQRTALFVDELKKAGLLMDGEVAIQPEGADKPFVYRGFQMVDEEKLREMRGDELRRLNQNGMLPLIFAHLFSLSMIRDVFSMQIAQGKGPVSMPQLQSAEA